MAAGRKVTIEFLGNNRDLDRAMDQSSSRAGRFGSALKKAGKVAALGLAAGALIAGKALFEMTKAAAADEAAQTKLANTLKNAAGATKEQIAQTEDWITKQGELYGVTDDELRPALAKLVTATGDVGKATKLASLAMNVSAGTGKSMEQVTKALADAENGRLGGLGKLGVATKNAKGETLSLEQIQKRLAKVHEGAAGKAANTLEGKMNRLKVQLSEAGEAIGAKLIPVVSQMVDWFVAKGLPAIQQFGGWMKENLFPIFENIGAVIRKVFGGMNGDVGGPLAEVKATIMQVVGVLKAIWAQFGDYYVGYLKRSLGNVLQLIKGAFQVIRGVIKVFSSLFKGDWKGVWEGVKLILKGALNIIVAVVKQAINVIKLAWKVGWTAVKAILSSVWDGIKNVVAKGVGAIIEFFKQLPGKIKAQIKELPADLKRIGGDIVDGLKRGIEGAWHKVLEVVSSLIKKIPKKIRDIMGISSPSKVTTYLGQMIGDGLARGIDKSGPKVDEALKKRISRIKDQLSTVKDLFSGLKDSVAGAFTGDLFQAENAQDFLAQLTSTRGTLGALKAAFATLTGWGLKPGFLAQLFQSGNAGLILDLAKNKASAQEAGSLFGGITNASADLGGMVATSQYGDEIKALQDKIKKLESKGGGKGRTTNFNITINGALDPVGVGRQVEKAVRVLERAEGRVILAPA